MTDNNASIVLDSSHSTQISLEAIREGDAGLNSHRQSMLIEFPRSAIQQRLDTSHWS